jgi:hypothetical protein
MMVWRSSGVISGVNHTQASPKSLQNIRTEFGSNSRVWSLLERGFQSEKLKKPNNSSFPVVRRVRCHAGLLGELSASLLVNDPIDFRFPIWAFSVQ